MWRRLGVNAATNFSSWVPKKTRWITIIINIISSQDAEALDNHCLFHTELCPSQLHHRLHHHHVQHQELGSVALDAPEGYNHLWGKTREAFHYIYHHHKVITFKNWCLHLLGCVSAQICVIYFVLDTGIHLNTSIPLPWKGIGPIDWADQNSEKWPVEANSIQYIQIFNISMDFNITKEANQQKHNVLKILNTMQDEAEWFLKSDDDTYTIVENLRLLLQNKNHSDPIFFGHKFKAHVKQV